MAAILSQNLGIYDIVQLGTKKFLVVQTGSTPLLFALSKIREIEFDKNIGQNGFGNSYIRMYLNAEDGSKYSSGKSWSANFSSGGNFYTDCGFSAAERDAVGDGSTTYYPKNSSGQNYGGAITSTDKIRLLSEDQYGSFSLSGTVTGRSLGPFWLINPYSGSSSSVRYVAANGGISWASAVSQMAAVPVFNLKSGATLIGTGTDIDPYTLYIDSISPTATFSYSPSVSTTGNVTATLVPSESVTVTNNEGSTSKVFTDNGSFTFEFVDAAGNTGSATATVSNIDRVAPTGTIAYSSTSPVNQDVTATLNTSETVAVTNNGGSFSKVFTSNGSFTFEFADAAGNTGSATATVSNIDKTAPTATISYSATGPTRDGVTATLSPSESLTVTNNGGVSSYTFTKNGSFTFEFVDVAGNTGSATATVNNITPPASILLKRGLKEDLPASAELGEPLFATDTNELFVGTGEGVTLLTVEVGSGKVTKDKLNSDVAGAGIIQDTDGSLKANTGSGIEISDDSVKVKADGISIVADSEGIHVSAVDGGEF